MLLHRFIKNRKGAVAPLLALSMIPIMGAVAASVDYSRASAIRSAMQSSLDATGLMLSKTAPDLSPTALNDQAVVHFTALFNRPEATNVAVTAAMTQPAEGSFNIALTGAATVNTLFAGVIGHSHIDLSVSSSILWGIKRLNLALALDNTGSMATDGKMAALKTAAHNLLATLQAAAKKPGDIQVSIIPFAVDVNMGTSNAAATWLDWTDWTQETGTCSRTRYDTRTECQSNGAVWTPTAQSAWNGCVKDRDQHNDVLNTTPVSGNPATKYRAHQAVACPTAMMPLSSDWTALNSKIDAMTPTGNTNVTIGPQMAWQTLSPGAPFNAAAPTTDLDRVIILLTDGENTQNRWTASATSINARTAAACANVKAANIRLYTVRVIAGNATLLRDCATNPSMYYDVQQADQLSNVFRTIAQNLANLRIAQ